MTGSKDLELGQVIKTMGRQIAIPVWYEKWDGTPDQKNAPRVGFKRIASMPIVRLDYGGCFWVINTNIYRQSGLVCFVPERYLGMAILSAQVVAICEKSVIAQPIEWIEVSPPLPLDWIGKDGDDIFYAYAEEPEQHKETRAVWHNKGE